MTEPTGKFYGQISWPYSQIWQFWWSRAMCEEEITLPLPAICLSPLPWHSPWKIHQHPELNSSPHPKNSQIIIGADINARLGRRDSNELHAVLGPYAPPHHNTRGSNLLSLYLSHKLRVENTFHMHQPIALTPTSKMVIRPWSTFMHVQSHSTAAYASAVRLSMASKLIMQLSILIWHSPCSSGQTWLLSEVPLIGNTLQLTNPPNSTTMISSLMPPSPLTCHSRHSIMQ
jgi:hypothetical protein